MTPVEWLRRRWGAECPDGTPVPAAERCAAVDCDSVCLTTLAEGDRARVTCLIDPGGSPARKLAALGILPGVAVVLVQRSPAFVFQIGNAEFAIDRGLAAHIRVRVENLSEGA
jgi:Fe2+ transport system protein FeoA